MYLTMAQTVDYSHLRHKMNALLQILTPINKPISSRSFTSCLFFGQPSVSILLIIMHLFYTRGRLPILVFTPQPLAARGIVRTMTGRWAGGRMTAGGTIFVRNITHKLLHLVYQN